MNYRVSDTDLTNIADAIRNKTNNNNSLVFPNDFISAINGISQTIPATYIPGIIRPDAELIETINYDKLFILDENITLPAYYTQSTSYRLTVPDSIDSSYVRIYRELDTENYHYLLITKSLIIPQFSSNVSNRVEWASGVSVYEFASLISLLNPLLSTNIDSTNFSQRIDNKYANNIGKYYNNQNTPMIYTVSGESSSLPFVSTSVSAVLGYYGDSYNWGLNISQPRLYLSGHATYLNEDAWNAITDIRIQLKISLYRINIYNTNIQGGPLGSLQKSVLNDIINNNMILT